MKKIALIFPKDSEAIFNKNSRDTFGGATVQLYLIAKELTNYNNIKIFLLINQYKDINIEDIQKFNFIKTFRDADNILKKIIIFQNKLNKLNPDIIIQRGLTIFSCLLALYCRIKKKKFIFMFAHDREIKGRYQRTDKKCNLFFLLLNNANLLICQSQHQLKKVENKYKSKCKVILSSYEISEFRNKTKDIILWVSRLEEWKRPDLYLKLAKKNPDKKFIMIAPLSPGYDDIFNHTMSRAQKISNLKFIDFVHFTEIDDYFKQASLFVNTSVQEGFPNTFIQACKNGTPILSLNVNPDNFITRYSCGFYCRDNFYLMNKNLNDLMKDKALYEKFSKNAYNYALKNHDIKKNVKVLMYLIN